MKKTYCYFLFTFFSIVCFGQGWNPVGSRSAALSNASVGISDVWSYFHNPGATAAVDRISIGAYYDTRFLTKELQTQAIAVAIPLKKGVITSGAQFFGYEQYRNTRAGLGYAMKFTDYFQIGVQGNVQTLRLGNNYGKTVSGTIEAGILAKLNEKWSIGFSVLNVGRTKIKPLNDRFATVMQGGLVFQPSKKIHLLAEVEKQVITKISFKGAIEYMPIEQLVIRLGAQSGPMEFSFGFGYKTKQIAMDLHTHYHPVLGWSPGIGFNYQLQKHEK